jgi:predicted Zn-dependent protease
VEDEVFYHPALAFYFPVPAQWQLTNAPTKVTIAEESGKALLLFDLARGNQFETALQETLEENGLLLGKETKKNINGFKAVEAELIQKSPLSGATPLNIKLTLLQDGEKIYRFLAVAQGNDTRSYLSAMDKSVSGFNRLRDPEKMNRKVERIHIVSAKKTASLSEILSDFNMPASRHEEFAVLNGMELSEIIKNNTLLKIVKNLKPE